MKRITFKTQDGHDAQGDLVAVGNEKAPGVVLIQEYWGVNDHVRDVASRLAKEGFRVLAVDLYHGKTTKDASVAAKMMGELDWGHAMKDIAAAVKHLKEFETSNGKVAVMGFCLGGALSLAAACNVPGLSAVVAFYGLPKEADYTKVTAPILAHFAKTDAWAKVELAEAIQKKVGKSMELHVYDEQHAFFNDTRPEVYGAESAKLAWSRTIAFLKKHL